VGIANLPASEGSGQRKVIRLALDRHSRVSVEVSAVDCLDQLFRDLDNFLSPRPGSVGILVDVVDRLGGFLCLLVGRLLGLGDDAFTCPKCLFDDKSSVKIGLGTLGGLRAYWKSSSLPAWW
jgi:hypothetical protein